jgi:general secretion pathway protein N
MKKFIPRIPSLPLLAFGLLAYLVALVLTFPAERAYAHWQASEQAAPGFALSRISGSVWAGEAGQALVQGQLLENVQWTLRPWSLLLGQVGLNWRFQLPESDGKGGYAQATTGLGLDGSVAFESLEAHLPAVIIGRIVKASALRPVGTVNLNLHDVLWDGASLVSATGRVVWSGAGISLLTPLALGDQSITLETADGAVKGVLSDGGGPLSLDGLLTVDAEGKYEFSGSLAARNAPDLQRALRSMGRPGADGRIKLKRSGSLTSLGLGQR